MGSEWVAQATLRGSMFLAFHHLLQPFSSLSHSIKDANTLECVIGPAPPRSLIHHLERNKERRQCSLIGNSHKAPHSKEWVVL